MKCRELLLVSVAGFVIVLHQAVLAPILPLEFKQRRLSPTVTGLVLASQAVAWLFTPPCLPACLFPCFGRRRTTHFGMFIVASALTLYGFLSYITDSSTFAGSTAIARAFQGFGSACAHTGLLSLISELYPQAKEKAQSLRFCGSTLGLITGLLICALIYHSHGYSAAFFTLACSVFLLSFLLLLFPENKEYYAQHGHGATYTSLLGTRRTLIALLNSVMIEVPLLALQPTLALKLNTEFSHNATQVSLYFAILLLGSLLGSGLALLVEECMDSRLTMIIGNLGITAAQVAVGPSKLFSIHNTPRIMALGLFWSGVARGLLGGVTLAEAIRGGVDKFERDEARVGDLVTSLNFTLMGVALFVVPVAASVLSSAVGFEWTMDGVFMLLFVFSVVQLVATLVDVAKEGGGDGFEEGLGLLGDAI